MIQRKMNILHGLWAKISAYFDMKWLKQKSSFEGT